jgi:hypothetical protein
MNESDSISIASNLGDDIVIDSADWIFHNFGEDYNDVGCYDPIVDQKMELSKDYLGEDGIGHRHALEYYDVMSAGLATLDSLFGFEDGPNGLYGGENWPYFGTEADVLLDRSLQETLFGSDRSSGDVGEEPDIWSNKERTPLVIMAAAQEDSLLPLQSDEDDWLIFSLDEPLDQFPLRQLETPEHPGEFIIETSSNRVPLFDELYIINEDLLPDAISSEDIEKNLILSSVFEKINVLDASYELFPFESIEESVSGG